MTDTDAKTATSDTVSAQVRGETIAHAVQSGLFSIGANLYEPYINLRVQKAYGKKYSYDAPAHQRYGSYGQNLAGELAGDISGSATLILAETFIPEQLHFCTRGLRKFIDPLYESVAQRVFDEYKGTPQFRQEIDKWKTFHERNLIRSGIVATAGLGGNLLTQKLIMKNPSPTKVIFLGKMLSTAVTTALGLSVRFLYPDQMKRLDSWMAKKYFTPNMQDKPLNGNGNGNGHRNADHVSKLLKEPYPGTPGFAR